MKQRSSGPVFQCLPMDALVFHLANIPFFHLFKSSAKSCSFSVVTVLNFQVYIPLGPITKSASNSYHIPSVPHSMYFQVLCDACVDLAEKESGSLSFTLCFAFWPWHTLCDFS